MGDRAETEYANGFDRGRTACLTKGPETARRWLREHRRPDAYREGYAAALWAYEDANGLPHDPISGVC